MLFVERSADEELHRQVIDPLGVLALVRLLRLQPALRQQVAQGEGDGLEALARGGGTRRHNVVEEEMTLVERAGVTGETHGLVGVMPQKVGEGTIAHRELLDA